VKLEAELIAWLRRTCSARARLWIEPSARCSKQEREASEARIRAEGGSCRAMGQVDRQGWSWSKKASDLESRLFRGSERLQKEADILSLLRGEFAWRKNKGRHGRSTPQRLLHQSALAGYLAA